jgi:hypothetical protein
MRIYAVFSPSTPSLSRPQRFPPQRPSLLDTILPASAPATAIALKNDGGGSTEGFNRRAHSTFLFFSFFPTLIDYLLDYVYRWEQATIISQHLDNERVVQDVSASRVPGVTNTRMNNLKERETWTEQGKGQRGSQGDDGRISSHDGSRVPRYFAGWFSTTFVRICNFIIVID